MKEKIGPKGEEGRFETGLWRSTLELTVDVVPVDKIPPGFDVSRSGIPFVYVIRMFPDIDGQNRFIA